MKIALFLVVCLFGTATAQTYDTLRVATYNILNYPGGSSASRNPEFRKVLRAINPDVLIVQEMQSSSGVSEFLDQVLNSGQPGTYTSAPFSNGPDTDNALFYKPVRVSFLSQIILTTALRDINGYVIRPAGVNSDSLDFRIYSAHLKASQGFESERESEATIVRNHLNTLGPGHYIFGGDFNLYTSTEGAYQVLLESQPDNDGRLYDVLNQPGSWHGSVSFAALHTQSPRTTNQGDGGATGGMDDRFDFLLPTYPFQGFPSWQVVDGSYTEYGNDGLHFEQAINNGTNFAVPDSIANALHAGSDHIPVYMDIVRQVTPTPTVVLSFPNGGESFGEGDTVSISWSAQNYGGTVSLSLSRTGAGGAYESLVNGTANDGQHSWVASGTPTTQARVKIVLDNAPPFTDISDGDFTIFDRELTVFTPVNGDSFAIGSGVSIQWTAVAVTGSVRVELNRIPSSPGWEVLAMSAPNSGSFGWTATGPVTDSARVRVLSAQAPAVGDTSAMFRIKLLNNNQPPVIFHNPVCDETPGNVDFFCSVQDDGAYLNPYLFWSSNGFVSQDSLQMSSVGGGYSGTVNLASGFFDYFLRVKDVGALVAKTDTFELVVQPACLTLVSYDDETAESYQWSGDVGMTWAVRFTPVVTPFVLCAANYALSVRKPDSLHGLIAVLVLDANGPGGFPGDTLGSFTSGALPNLLSGNAGTSPGWGRTVLLEDGDLPLTVAGDFYLAISEQYGAFALDHGGAALDRSLVWDACDQVWYPEDGVHANSRQGHRMIRAEGFALLPPTVVILASGNDAILKWTPTGAPNYTIYRASLPAGPFDTAVGATVDTSWTDAGVISSMGQAFYVVKSSLP